MQAHESCYDVVLTFGKHRGLSLGEIAERAPAYIRWGADTFGLPTDWRIAFKRVLEGKPVHDLALPRKSKGVSVASSSPLNGPSPGKIQFSAVDGCIVVVKFPYNRNNPKDVERKDKFKADVDSAKWNSDKFRWEISPLQIKKAVESFGGIPNCEADEQVKEWYRDEVARRQDLDVIRVKDDTDFHVPTLLELYPYQKVGVEFIDRAGGRALIGDQMGLGKTATAIGYAVLHNLKTLVVCPKAVKVGWVREILRFSGIEATIWTGTKSKGGINSQFHVINYDAVEKNLGTLQMLGFQLVVGDEATYVKNKKSRRARAFLKGLRDIERTILLTGTPVLNRPKEAFPLLNFVDSERFASEWKFHRRYGGWRNEPYRNLDELHHSTKDVVIRRLKSEVQSEMPPKQLNDLFVEMTPTERYEYNRLIDQMIGKWRGAGKPTVAEIPAIQKFLFEIKKQRVVEMVDELLEQGRSVLLFSVYREQMQWFAKHYESVSAHLDGSMTEKKRQAAIDALRDGKAKVGCMTLGAGGMGIDGLQHSIETVIFLDQWFVPAWHEQAEDRVHRTGQRGQVSIFYALVEGTIDEDMRHILVEKQKMIDEVVDGRSVSGRRVKGFFKEFAAKLKQRHHLTAGNMADADEIEEAA